MQPGIQSHRLTTYIIQKEGKIMKRVYIFKDGMMQGSTATRESAIDLIRQYQARETHPILKAQFSIISGEEEFIPYSRSEEKPKT